MEHRPPIDETGALAFLTARFGPGISGIERLGHGEWSTAFGYRHDGHDFVLRFGSHRDDFERDRLAGRFTSAQLPVPRVVEIGAHAGWHVAISERAAGEFLDTLDAPRMRALLPSLFATLDAMREADLTPTTGFGGVDPNGNAPYETWRAFLTDATFNDTEFRLGNWRGNLERSPLGTDAFDRTHAILCKLAEYVPNERHLIHSDLLNFNVLVQGESISAVFDWGCMLYGDFLYDCAWFSFWQPWYPQWAGIDFREDARAHFAQIGLEVPCFDLRFAACEIHIGISNLAYCAFKERWDQAADVARRCLVIAETAMAELPPR